MAVTGHRLEGLDKAAAEASSNPGATPKPGMKVARLLQEAGRRLLWLIAAIRRLLALTIFASLTRRIVFLNLVALAVLVVGILYLNQWRAGLIDARVQSLRVQGEIIAAAIAASATVDSDVISINPDRLLQLQPGDTVSPLSFYDPALEFPINPEQVAPLLRNLVTPTGTRARIYDQDGLLILDSANIYARGDVLRQLNPPQSGTGSGFFLFDWWNTVMSWVPGDDFPRYQEFGADEGKRYPEVDAALTGNAADIVRVDDSTRGDSGLIGVSDTTSVEGQRQLLIAAGEIQPKQPVLKDLDFDIYKKTRMDGQKEWYDHKIINDYALHRRSSRASRVAIGVGAVAAAVGLASNPQFAVLITITTALSVAITSDSNVNMFGKTYGLFQKASQDLGNLNRRWLAKQNNPNMDTPEKWIEVERDFVEQVEKIAATEREAWHDLVINIQTISDGTIVPSNPKDQPPHS